MSSTHQLSVLIVSYNSARLALRAAESVLKDAPGSEVIIVDNASKDTEELKESGLPLRLIFNDENKGLSRALLQGFQESRGNCLLILNPDTLVLPGSLRLMMDALEDSTVGGVGPKFWWDEGKSMLLPPIPLPTPWDYCLDLILSRRGFMSKWLNRREILKAMGFWKAEGPTDTDMLSGAAIMTRRDVAERVGLFDPRFFLYYEDSDWCQRVRKAGLRLLYHPQAEMVHLFNQSGKQNPEVVRHMAESREIYLGRHFSRWQIGLSSKVASWLESRAFDVEYQDLGVVKEPPCFTWDGEGEHLIQVGLGPAFRPAAGGFASGGSFQLPTTIWRNLGSGRYWSRVVRLSDFEVIGTYSWEKAE